MKRWLSVVWASVIAAAFLGPGTVTTAARAGSAFGLTLLWALLFSTLACFVLQEAAARLTTASGLTLGAALGERFGSTASRMVLGAIVLGCAAYEAGNILGGVAGARISVDLSPRLLTLLVAGAAGVLLWLASSRLVVAVLSAFVGVMGVAFLVTALRLAPPLGELAAGLLRPSIPSGSGLLVLGLVGTTVVPYNLFLGSGLARGQERTDWRFGLAFAIGFGGLISMAVVLVGRAVVGDFSFEALAQVLEAELGGWAKGLFAMGLFGAGFTSAVTAPLAAAVTARSVLSRPSNEDLWRESGWRYRVVWLGVLAFGAIFGVAEVRPVPAIVAAQALNGLLLPLAAIFLLLAVNDRGLMGKESLNGWLSNLFMALAVGSSLVLGTRGVASAASSLLGWEVASEGMLMGLGLAFALLLAWPITSALRRGRHW